MRVDYYAIRQHAQWYFATAFMAMGRNFIGIITIASSSVDDLRDRSIVGQDAQSDWGITYAEALKRISAFGGCAGALDLA
jgi:hypothetical protein